MAVNRVEFIDAMRCELVQRVSLVMPLADKLLQEKHISKEMYANIQAKTTEQGRMRELWTSLNTNKSKEALYEALQENEPHLLAELEEKYRKTMRPGTSGNATTGSQFLEQSNMEVQHPQTGPSSTGSSSLPSSSVPGTKQPGSQRVDMGNIEGRWCRISKNHRTIFEDLLKDRDVKHLGNGKLLLCTKDKYKIGNGAEGTHVFIGMRDDGTEVAVKRMIKSSCNNLQNEMKILRGSRLEHKNIVRYLDYTEDNDFYYLCLQLCECNFEKYKAKLTQDALKKVAQDLLCGLQALHDAGIIHRDLKPSNILIDVNGNAKLADFGISRMLDQDRSTVNTSRVGTQGWEATEILRGNETSSYKRSTDIQVAGMLVYYILSGGEHPFGTHWEREANIVRGEYKLDEKTDVEAKDLIEKMIDPDPKDRLSVEEAVGHPYFWDDERRELFLRTIGDEEPVQKYKDLEKYPELQEALKKHTMFTGWKSQITDLKPRETDNFIGLLRFLRNKLVHDTDNFYGKNMYKDLFPEFYVHAYQLAKDMGWK